MLIKSLKLENFRAYKDATINFSTDPVKKMTVILGDNTYGKTTIVNAFIWCLYRENRFKIQGQIDKMLLNNEVAYGLAPGEYKDVKVTLTLEHNGCDYTIVTTEIYRKNQSGLDVSVTSPASTSIRKDDHKRPTPMFVDEKHVNGEIDSILHSGLYDYFFFDGETNTVKQVASKKNLKDAVLDLLDINRVEEIQKLFNPKLIDSVYSDFSKKMDEESKDPFDSKDTISQKLKTAQDEYQEAIDKMKYYDEQKKELDSQKQKLKDELDSVQDIITNQKQKNSLDKTIEDYDKQTQPIFKGMIDNWNANRGKKVLDLLYAKSYKKFNIEETLTKTSYHNELSYSHISGECIDELLERGQCLCGAKIEPNNETYNNLLESKKHMDPIDCSEYVTSFTNASETNVSDATSSTFSLIESARNFINHLKLLDDYKTERDRLKKLVASDKDYGYLQTQIDDIDKNIENIVSKKAYFQKQFDDSNKKISDLNESLKKRATIDKNKAYLSKCRDYAKRVFDEATKKIAKSNNEIKEGLQNEVQKVFDLTFHGERKIQIDDQLNVTTVLSDGTKQSSTTGLDVVTSFSFVVGLMNLAKKYISESDNDSFSQIQDLDHAYPLVLDAPFSDLDLIHIQNLCDVFAKYCDQTIIVVMEKDFDYANQKISSYIGKRYRINQISQSYSTIEED